ncbi:hypothetical protein [Oharaeibacter diazotrophicus]|uniref:hypothetical protein n=1 Tax=Oharaeibacter diazotrophicus TaxID=1920512 RepID=UPI000DC7621A|nr:hypothetical protein [Oharaeibacter diazotrophicus]BBE70522.1 hypothetical protein OHA_1_00086 [Pleomorphomonas sp. SM30]GLS77268.1 hypothetical protein GCM10007904_26050 [Oharaeibacter diazotrophicus]
MSPTKTLIADAVARFPLEHTAEWAKLTATFASAEVDRIETDAASISTVDFLFDGRAVVVLKDAAPVPARVFGRCDGRRAEIERIVFAA